MVKVKVTEDMGEEEVIKGAVEALRDKGVI